MFYSITALVLFLAPLLPANIPANMIYMGPTIDPIHSIKIKRGYVADETYMLLTPSNFIRLKSVVENTPDLCTLAVDESIKKCMAGMQREQEIMLSREIEDQQIIQAYETRLQAIEKSLQATNKQNTVLLWTASSFALVATVAVTVAAVR